MGGAAAGTTVGSGGMFLLSTGVASGTAVGGTLITFEASSSTTTVTGGGKGHA